MKKDKNHSLLLVIDIGNTETVLGLYRGDDLEAHWRLSSKMQRTADECWILLTSLYESEFGPDMTNGIGGVVIASVVPSLTAAFAAAIRTKLNVDPVVVTSDMDIGLTISYDSPRTVGADRLCNAVAGYAQFGGPLIVVDFGTATTFDVVSETGDYIGGAISLGLHGASQELHRVAAKLPRVDLVFPESAVGKTTETSIQSGIMWGSVALVDGMIERICHDMEWKKAAVIATGGIAPLFMDKSKQIQSVEPLLTLKGMRMIYNRLRPHTE